MISQLFPDGLSESETLRTPWVGQSNPITRFMELSLLSRPFISLYQKNMQSSSRPLEPDRESTPTLSTEGVSLLLSISTLPVVVGLLAVKNMGKFWQELGQDSEELFRGDRLPLLTEPPQTPTQSNPEV